MKSDGFPPCSCLRADGRQSRSDKRLLAFVKNRSHAEFILANYTDAISLTGKNIFCLTGKKDNESAVKGKPQRVLPR